MKVLLTCSSSSRTGPVEGLISLASYAREQGIDARFGGDTVRPGEDLDAHLARAGVPWERELRLSRKVRLRDVVHDARALPKLGFDLVHAAMAHDHLLALWSGAKVVRAVQRRADARRLWPLRRSDAVIVHATRVQELLEAAAIPVTLVPGSVDAGRFTPGPSTLRARWGVPAEAPLAGIVARMKPERGHRELLRAFAAHAPRDAWLVLVGRGEDEAELRRLAGERVVFGGYARGEELVDAYRALDAAVWLREGNDGACRGVLEAMACGVPVVAGAEGAQADYVEDEVSGLLVDPADPVRIGEALRRLLGDLGAARAMGREARLRAEQFPPQRAHAATLAVWRSICGTDG